MKKSPCSFLILSLLLLLVYPPVAGFAESRMPPPDYPIIEAVKGGDVQQVKAILQRSNTAAGNSEVNRRGQSGDTPLSVASRKGNIGIVKLLIEYGAMVDGGKEGRNRTPLIEAAGQGQTEVVQYLIAKGADVNAKRQGVTALLAAFTERHSPFSAPGDEQKTIRSLLENGADVNVQDESWMKTGRTPLMLAVAQGDAALVQLILSKGANLDLKNKDGDTALSLAKKKGLTYIAQLLEAPGSASKEPSPQTDLFFKAVKEKRLDEVKVQVAKGADVNCRNSYGSTPLMAAADGNAPEIAGYLLKRGADVNAKNGTNNTALIYAARKGHIRIVNALLRKKADPNVKDIAGGDALIYAVLNKKTEVVWALLQHGAGVNEKYDDKNTALITAVKEGSADIINLLTARRADVNATDQFDMTALMIACEKGRADIVATLLEAGADIHKKSKYGDSALSKAITAKHARIVSLLLKKSGKFDRQGALYTAVGTGDLKIVKLLLTRSIDVNMRGYAGTTLLMRAVDKNYEMVKWLVERGADVNLKDNEGTTALLATVASFNDLNVFSAKLLIDHGADVNAVNNKGESALILAAKRGNAEMVKLLIEKGGELSAKDKTGKSAWSYASEGTNSAIIDLLGKAGAARNYLGVEWKGNVSNQKEKFVEVVETQKEWSELWRRAFGKEAPEMDFDKYVVACVFLGHSASWLYSIGFDQPFLRDNQLVIPYGLNDVMLRLSGPFKAGGQYYMRVFEKMKDVSMILEETKGSAGKYR